MVRDGLDGAARQPARAGPRGERLARRRARRHERERSSFLSYISFEGNRGESELFALLHMQTIVVHAGEGSSAMRAEGRQWVALLNKRTDGAEDAMMWKATGTVAVGAWPLLQ